jgi:hypothetical protein
MDNITFIVTEDFTTSMKRKSYQLAYQRRVCESLGLFCIINRQ